MNKNWKVHRDATAQKSAKAYTKQDASCLVLCNVELNKKFYVGNNFPESLYFFTLFNLRRLRRILLHKSTLLLTLIL